MLRVVTLHSVTHNPSRANCWLTVHRWLAPRTALSSSGPALIPCSQALMARRRAAVLVLLALVPFASAARVPAQQPPPPSQSPFGEMRWRNIGPFRAGRTKAAAGHPSQPYTFYIGVCNGGV